MRLCRILDLFFYVMFDLIVFLICFVLSKYARRKTMNFSGLEGDPSFLEVASDEVSEVVCEVHEFA